MELLNATYCPYCKSWIDVESMLTLDNLKNMHFYLTCPECKKTFTAFAKTEVTVKVGSIENAIKENRDSLFFWERMKGTDKEQKRAIVKQRERLIEELEAIKERNDSKE